METINKKIPLFDFISCISRAMDLISHRVAHHHEQVAFLALSIAEELGYDEQALVALLSAAYIHDIGALSLKERLNLHAFTPVSPQVHAEIGYRLLRDFELLRASADIVRFHHLPWKYGEGRRCLDENVPEAAHLINLADRIAICIDPSAEVLGQSDLITKTIMEHSGSLFIPEHVEAYRHLSKKEYFWLDSVSPRVSATLSRKASSFVLNLNMKTLREMAKLFSRIIDFRSPFTATHSSGVAETACNLARLSGFDSDECDRMRIAGLIHDLGKLAVPAGILLKPDKLTKEEFNVIRAHTFHTLHTLEPVEGLGTIAQWGAYHHERLNGTGYPFHVKGDELSTGARILAVADVFTALTENRPYRNGTGEQVTLSLIQQMAGASVLDSGVVALLRQNYDEINAARSAAQLISADEYAALQLSC